MLRTVAAVSLATLTALMGGCASPEASALYGAHVSPDEYARTFQAARETLRDYRFALDRVDAPQGVLTTAERSEPGLLKPWAAHSGTTAAVNDLVNFQQRIVHVAFVTGPAPAHNPGEAVIPMTDPGRDLVSDPRATTMLVRVVVQRVERPDRRVSMDTVRVERQAIDPVMREKDMWPSYLAPAQDDTVFAAQLLKEIVARSAAMKTADQSAPAPAAPEPPSAPTTATPSAAAQPAPEAAPVPETPR